MAASEAARRQAREDLRDKIRLEKDFIRKLGPHIKCSHLKGVKMQSQVTVHIDEVRVGTGNFDVATFLREIASLKNVPILSEHLKSEAEYRKAVDQGFAAAQSNLGTCYENGTGVQKDPKQAVHWYRKAAEQGHTSAQVNLWL